MRGKILFGAALMTTLSGCMMWDAGYTGSRPVTTFAVPRERRVPVTYSITLAADMEETGGPTEEGLSKRIREALRATGLYSAISRTGPEAAADANGHHIAFEFQKREITGDGAETMQVLSGCTLAAIPAMSYTAFDGKAVVSRQGKAAYATVKAEETRTLIWAPALPIGLFMNAWAVWSHVESGTVNALVNDVAAEHRRAFFR